MTRQDPLDVTFLLPALTEATSPFWRPIKYSLFPPLGLATLAGFLNDHAERLGDLTGDESALFTVLNGDLNLGCGFLGGVG